MTTALTMTPIAGESLEAFMRRWIRHNLTFGFSEGLSFVDIPVTRLFAPSETDLSAISQMTGTPKPALEATTFRRSGVRGVRAIGPHQLDLRYFRLKQRAYCPLCMLSSDPCLPKDQVLWKLRSHKVCQHHGIALQADPTSWGNWAPMQFNMDSYPLREVAAALPQQRPSSLQLYVDELLSSPQRNAGEEFRELMDTVPLLGALAMLGFSGRYQDLDPKQQWQADDIGCKIYLGGPERIREFLAEQIEQSQIRAHRPRAIMGDFYVKLREFVPSKRIATLRAAAFDVLLDHCVMRSGEPLLGFYAEGSRVWNARHFATMAKGNRRTVAKTLAAANIIPNDRDVRATFPDSVGRKMMDELSHSYSIHDLTQVLDCSRQNIQEFIRAGYTPLIVGTLDDKKGVKPRVSARVAHNFWDDVYERAKRSSNEADELVDIRGAATRTRWPMFEIFEGIFQGDITRVEYVRYGFNSLLVDPDEVHSKLMRKHFKGALTYKEASKKYGLRTWAISQLTTQIGPNGKPYVLGHEKGATQHQNLKVVNQKSLESFLQDYVKLKDIAKANSKSAKVMKEILDQQRIGPILPKGKLNGLFYPRASVAHLLK